MRRGSRRHHIAGLTGLAAIQHVGMKDSASSGIEGFLQFESESFHVLAGSANFLFPAMLRGSLGGTVSMANSFPELVVELWHCGQARDEALGLPLQERVARINKSIAGRYAVSGVKAAMDLAGYRGGMPRRPLLPFTVENTRNQTARVRGLLSSEQGGSACPPLGF
jgi:4-hydroxy-2-oxoglutarate aldolase